MKKTAIGITLMMLSAFGMTAVARNNDNRPNNCNAAATCNTTCNPYANNSACSPDSALCPAQRNCSPDSATCSSPCLNGKGSRNCNAAVKGAGKGHHRYSRVANASFDRRHGKIQKDFKKGGLKTDTRSALFNGIELTADQQTRLNQLDSKMAADRTKAREVAKEKKAQAKAEMTKAKDATRTAYDKGVKEILTKEQYAKYELNRKEMQVRKDARSEARKLKSEMRKATPAKGKASSASSQTAS